MNILLIGGTGFVGSAIARQLTEDEHSLRIATRRRERAKHLIVLPTTEVVEADVHDPQALQELMRGQDVVISMVGVLHGNFTRVHAELPGKIAVAAKAAGVRRIIHISALGAAVDAASAYGRSKAAGEQVLKDSGLDVTILRPSVIFGHADNFLNMFARLQFLIPVFPLACPDARFQPVWVEDVARTISACLSHKESIGQTYCLGGPHIYSLRQLVRYAGTVAGKPAAIIGLSRLFSYLQALLMELIPGAPMKLDNYRSMQMPNVCDSQPCLPFGLPATPLEAVAPGYLRRGGGQQHNDRYRESAGR